ncbi:MAG: aminopeptidase [Dehalobacterium sp.]
MEYPIGIEMRDEYKSFELAKGAMTLVKDIMLVKSGENVVVNVDTAADMRIANAIVNAAFAVGAMPVLIQHPLQKEAFTQPPAPVAGAVAQADVWIELAYNTIMHSPAFRDAMAFGTRYTCLTGMDVEMLVNTIANVDCETVIAFGEYIVNVLEQADEIIVKSKKGTDLRARKKDRYVKHSGQKATKKGFPVMLCGQVTVCPLEDTIEGTLVFDGALFPPKELGKLNEDVILQFENGRITEVSGGQSAQIFKNWLDSFNDPNMYRLAHYSLGFNPGVIKPTGRIVEDERVFGCIEFGIGSQGKSLGGAFWNAASHTDGIVLNPTIILDGKVFEDNGVYLDAQAREFCRKLGVQGYF